MASFFATTTKGGGVIVDSAYDTFSSNTFSANRQRSGGSGSCDAMNVRITQSDCLTAYGRGHTPFTLWAKSLHAARTTKGWGMLVEQAAESFLLWRGIRPDTQPVLQALSQHT